MTELDRGLEQRLERARLGLSPTLDARARVRERLAARGAFSPGVARGGALGGGRSAVSALLGAALMGVSFAGGYWLRDVQDADNRPEASIAQRASAAPDGTRPAARQASPAVLLEPSLTMQSAAESQPAVDAGVSSSHDEPKRARSASRHRRDAPSASVAATGVRGAPRAPASSAADSPPKRETTRDELALLRRVERAIRAGDPALALILLDQLERAYPTSALGEERTAARVLVECARSGELAKPDAARFIDENPQSVYSDRIVRACRLETTDDAESPADVRSDGH